MTQLPEHGSGWSLRLATGNDAQWMADLKAEVMRADLQRLGYWDRDWARQRFLDAFVAANTSVVVTGGEVAGCIAVRGEPGAWWIEHFYLRAETQGRGLGGQVLRHVMAEHDDGRPFRLALDRGSRVRALYERQGFVHVGDDDNGVDQIFQRPARPDEPSMPAVASVGAEPVPLVVCAVLVRGDRALLVHRSPRRRWYPDVWDLPGGHVKDGEDPRAAVVRELREELGVDALVVGDPIARTVAGDFVADVWVVHEWSGSVVNAAPEEHDALAWLRVGDLQDRALAHPDVAGQVRLALAAGGSALREG